MSKVDLFSDNSIQFPRLLAEIVAVGLTDEQIEGLAVSMDLDTSEVHELFIRAEKEWDVIRMKHAGSPQEMIDQRLAED